MVFQTLLFPRVLIAVNCLFSAVIIVCEASIVTKTQFMLRRRNIFFFVSVVIWTLDGLSKLFLIQKVWWSQTIMLLIKVLFLIHQDVKIPLRNY